MGFLKKIKAIPQFVNVCALCIPLAILALILLKPVFFPPPKPKYAIRIAVPGFQTSALMLIAMEKGFLSDEGVEAAFEFRNTGFECLQLVLEGKSDLAIAYETPVIHAALGGHNLSILTEVHRSELNTAIVGRKDRGITGPKTLLRKKIGVVPKTNAEFLLDLYLRSHLLDSRQAIIVERKVRDLVTAVSSGEVDAAALWEPYVSESISKNPENFILLRSSFYTEFSMLVGLRDNVEKIQDASEAVLRALIKAQSFFENQKPEAQQLVEKALVSRGFYVHPKPWVQSDIQMGLSKTLLEMLEQEVKWYQSKSGSNVIIDMKAALYGPLLKDLAPERVTYE